MRAKGRRGMRSWTRGCRHRACRSRRTAGCRRPPSEPWPGPPRRPGSARCSWPRGTATPWPCAIRWRPRPGGCGSGTAIANAALRPPVLAAKTAAQLDHATGGRFVLGLGVANTIMNTRFGIAPFAPLPMIEEYVGVVRAVLGGSPGGYDGQVYRTGMVPLDSPPVRAGLPVYLAALSPRMLALAGRIADGVILNLMTPAQAGSAAGVVRAAARAAGRDPASVEIVCVVHCALSDDPAAAAAAARAMVLRYVLHPSVPRLFGELDGGPGLGGGARAAAGWRPGRGRRAGAAAGGRRVRGPRRRGAVREAGGRVPGRRGGPAGPVPGAHRRRLGLREGHHRPGRRREGALNFGWRRDGALNSRWRRTAP